MPYQSLIGKTAPTIILPNYDGELYTFTPGEKGVPAALFFYPGSGIIEFMNNKLPLLICLFLKGSYGCTKEACQFRDAIAGGSKIETQRSMLSNYFHRKGHLQAW
jgi:peroxiredoxin Q/BCP